MEAHRMLSLKIIDSANFLKMPVSVQLLYFHLVMRADDDGIVEAFNVLRITNSNEDDLKILVAKEYVKILNNDLVTYIPAWLEHNKIRPDRKKDSIYKGLLMQVIPDVQLIQCKPRSDRTKDKKVMDVKWTVHGQHKISKDKLSEVKLIKDNISKDNIVIMNKFVDRWNELGLDNIDEIYKDRIKDIIQKYKEDILIALDNIEKSDYLMGKNNNRKIKIDWFLVEENFLKVLENKYCNVNNDIKNNYKNFNNFNGRHYYYDKLERKLLGWDE